jgi:hypothetical protein
MGRLNKITPGCFYVVRNNISHLYGLLMLLQAAKYVGAGLATID